MESVYKEQIKKLEDPDFQQIIDIAKQNCGRECPGVLNCKPWKATGHGIDLLDSHVRCCKYLCAYGKMHEFKITDAIKALPEILLKSEFEVVDWGCGQGIGTLCLYEYLRNTGRVKNVKKVTLIEPSVYALERAALHLRTYTESKGIPINIIPEYFENITNKYFKSKNGLPIVHIFSNILDVQKIDLKGLASMIHSAILSDNYIVSVGPLNNNNRRIDAFYNYFKVPLIYNKEISRINYGGNRPGTYKAKVYKLEYCGESNLKPIEFYPPVQFYSSYSLDGIFNLYIKKCNSKNKLFYNLCSLLNAFEVATPFDIGASVYDDVHPILAVLNNIITRGLPTKASPYLENEFVRCLGITKQNETIRGELSYSLNKDIDYEASFNYIDESLLQNIDPDYSRINKEELQLIASPIAIARIQKVVLEALMTTHLSFDRDEWKVLVEEKDVPCAALAFKDLEQMFNNLCVLSERYSNLRFPKIELDVISNEVFCNSALHLDAKVSDSAKPKHFKGKYDLVIEHSLLRFTSISKDSFSQFNTSNNCYFNVQSSTTLYSNRYIYTTDRIKYRNLVYKNEKGEYNENKEASSLATYFLALLFRKESFRPGQLPILDRALQNKPVIGLLPTGGGKSLTYQIAALLQPGVTLIIDPLKSLMKDQYDGLIKAGVDCCSFINSSVVDKDKRVAMMEHSQLLFMFLSPERLAMYNFREKLKNMYELGVYFSYGVIDEVHCVSEWGHDFRFSYLHLGRNLYNYVRAKGKNENVTLFGLTATASFDVLADVERELSGNGAFPLDTDTIVRYENSDRLELQYKIEKVSVDFDDEITVLQKYLKKLEKENPKKIAKINSVKTKISGLKHLFFPLIENKLPLPVKISDQWAFYRAKQEFLDSYICKIPNYINEIQSDDAIERIKTKFKERHSLKEEQEAELKVNNLSENLFIKQDIYKQAGIIFCPHVKNTGIAVNEVRNSLSPIVSDIGTFSGSDDAGNSMQNLEAFRDNKQPLMVATKAFGMGIDKPNVRFTTNLNYSSSLEGFVQEAGRSGRDRKMALATILLSDYKLIRINYKHPVLPFGLNAVVRGRWFNAVDIRKIVDHYKLKIDSNFVEVLSPLNDYVRIVCREVSPKKVFGFAACTGAGCSKGTDKCQLKKIQKNAEGWHLKSELISILDSIPLSIDKKYIECQNADYETVMHFYNESFKGENYEKSFMNFILNELLIDTLVGGVWKKVNGFLTPLLSASKGEQVVSYIPYNDNNETDIAKAIYRMTCIGLINDFTQDYHTKKYRIVSFRKMESEYYRGLLFFLKRYYSDDRAIVEIEKAKVLTVSAISTIQEEIYCCLQYLTSFVYDKISLKRKRAIDDMHTFCLEGIQESKDWKETNEDLKDFIFFYFNSKYARKEYKTVDDEAYSIVEDTNEGKYSDKNIIFKYLRVVDEDFITNKSEPGSTQIDNTKHLQGAIRILRRSVTDSNPTIDLLNAFCLFFLGTNNNENLEDELEASYREGMLEQMNRFSSYEEFIEFFEKYNSKVAPFYNGDFENFSSGLLLDFHSKKLKQIRKNYTN